MCVNWNIGKDDFAITHIFSCLELLGKVRE